MTSGYICYNSSAYYMQTVQDLGKLHYMRWTVPKDLRILDWANLPCKLLVALPTYFSTRLKTKIVVLLYATQRRWIESE